MEVATDMKKKLLTASIVLLLLVPFLFGGCTQQPAEGKGFEVYLVNDGITVNQMEMLSHLDTPEYPLISGEDIVSYDWNTHSIKLTFESYYRLQEMRPTTDGKAFLVCIDKAPIYWGAFWAPYSSQSFDGITIMIPTLGLEENTIEISPGYPSGDFYRGDDPRTNPLIKEALEKAGKLVMSGIKDTTPASTPLFTGGFAIFLTKDNIPPVEMDKLSHVDITDNPVIFQDDIVAYKWDTHEMTLTPEAFARMEVMMPPTTGTSFVVCVDKIPIYWGAFWAGYSSQSFNGVVIAVAPLTEDKCTIAFRPGYPVASYYKGEDPRSNITVKEALEKAGKLK
jgi:hypothetical protein